MDYIYFCNIEVISLVINIQHCFYEVIHYKCIVGVKGVEKNA